MHDLGNTKYGGRLSKAYVTKLHYASGAIERSIHYMQNLLSSTCFMHRDKSTLLTVTIIGALYKC